MNIPEEKFVADEKRDTDYLNGQDEILEFYEPIHWNTIKGWLKAYGVPVPEKGDIWKVRVKDAVAIRMKKKSFIERKKKNIKNKK